VSKTDISHNTLTLNGVEYVRKDSIPATNSAPLGDMRIIVADRGWIFVGACVTNPDGTVTITNAKNIRRWGTTEGLGELANGPLTQTKADPYGTVRCTPIVEIGVLSGW
jgi:hypothetical protein